MALLAHWKLDENSGTDPDVHPADSSGHANDHSFTASAYHFSALGFWNRMRHANRNDNHRAVNNNADFLALTGDVTIMAWLKLTGAPLSDEYIVGCGLEPGETQAENVLWSLLVRSDGSFGMRWEHTGGVEVTAFSPAGQLPDDHNEPNYVHIAVVRSINAALRDVKFIVNGVDLAADVLGLTAPDGGASGLTELLREPGNQTLDFGGSVWNVRVYDTAESTANVLAVYNAELPGVARAALFNSPTVGTVIQPGLSDDPLYDVAPNLGYIGAFAGGGLGAAYERREQGSELDVAVRRFSGWAGEQP